ncbi:MAG: alpha/beta hydrolase [Oscillospiraceae bacterium]|nr:alpha/beta hydrolase [Oscillospiraceae bacterium]
MIYKTIPLYPDRPHITLTTYVSENSPELRNLKKKAVLVLPGGGYYITSDREAEPVAKAFFAAGMNAFILRYSVKEEAVGYTPLLDAATAMKYIRDHAGEWNIDKDKIVVCGFSAGGHLAATIGTLWKLDVISKTLGCENSYIRPNGMILGYPVITSGEKGHRGSILKLADAENRPATHEELDRFSLEKHVDSDTCPAFVWHTSEDSGVPVENSLYMCEALAAHKIPFELHVFPYGEHGLSLANEEVAPNENMVMPYVARWIDMAIKWIDEILFR